MNTLPTAKRGNVSATLVLSLGVLMTGWASLWLAGFTLSVDLRWYLPILAAWLGHCYGARVLLAWWPLAVVPQVGFRLWDGPYVGFGVSTTTLLLSICVAIAFDRRSTPRALEDWIRPGWRLAVQLAFCLLVLAAIDGSPIRSGAFGILLHAIPSAVIFFGAIRWRALVRGLNLPILQRRPHLEWGVAALAAALVVVASVVVAAGGAAHATADGPDHYRVRGVSPGRHLTLRAEPSTASAPLARIPSNATCLRGLGCQGQQEVGGHADAERHHEQDRGDLQRHLSLERSPIQLQPGGIEGLRADRVLATNDDI